LKSRANFDGIASDRPQQSPAQTFAAMYDVRHTPLGTDNQKTSGQVLPRSEHLLSKYFTRGSEGFLARGFEVG
jgi:hypothetical protein